MTDIEEALEWVDARTSTTYGARTLAGLHAVTLAAEVRRFQALEKSSREALAVARKALKAAKKHHEEDCDMEDTGHEASDSLEQPSEHTLIVGALSAISKVLGEI